ncbi:MAG: PIN domain-containing protein [Chloroflexi bacterium]|nr:PIN domain-containing protein [Chloroflexota bacterium]
MPFTVLLDADVIYSIAPIDTVLRAAEQDLFRPIWSEQILEEAARAIKRKLPPEVHRDIDRRFAFMRLSFPDAAVDGYQDLIPVMTNHEKDRHVLAAVVRGGAAVIVTNNVKDFPPESCRPYDIEVQRLDTFLCHLWSLNPERMTQVLQEQAADYDESPRDVLQRLTRTVPTFAHQALNSELL